MSFRRSGNIEDSHRAADLKEFFDLKLKESRKEANFQRISNSANKAKAVWETNNQERTSVKSEKSFIISVLEIRFSSSDLPNLSLCLLSL